MAEHPQADITDALDSDDTDIVASLIRSTAPAVWDWVFNDDHDAQVRCMAAWWQSDESVWSYQNARVIRGDDTPIGLLLSFTHAEFQERIGPSIEIAERILSEAAFAHMLDALGKFRAIIIEIGEDASYVNQVAVVDACRGQGLGEKLLHDEFGRAAAKGLKAVELDVNADNPRAKALYERLGMYVFSTISAPPLAQYGFETHHRMRIDL